MAPTDSTTQVLSASSDVDPLAPDWVEQIFAEINLLVLEGDAAGLAEHVSKLAGARLMAGSPGARMPT